MKLGGNGDVIKQKLMLWIGDVALFIHLIYQYLFF